MKLTGKTETGRRPRNEDSYLILTGEDCFLAAVSDGMGGHAAGETASRLSIETLYRLLSSPGAHDESDLRAAFSEANRVVCSEAEANPAYSGMGATLVAALLTPAGFYAANVGDSRLYLYDGKTLRQITHDHSFVAELVRRGIITKEEARTHPRRNLITRSIGSEPEVNVDLFDCSWNAGDILLLCSDGLCGTLLESEMADILNHIHDLDTACSVLIERALQQGSSDNITVVLAQNTEDPA